MRSYALHKSLPGGTKSIYSRGHSAGMDSWGIVTLLSGAVLIILGLGAFYDYMALGGILADLLLHLMDTPNSVIIIGIGAAFLGAYGIRTALKD